MLKDSQPIQLFGRRMALRLDDSSAGPLLRAELAVYPVAGGHPHHTITVTHEAAPLVGMPNPKSHIELSDGFVARYPNASVRYLLGHPASPSVVIHLPTEATGVRRARLRWRSIQYATPEESAGQLVHELAAIPLLYWTDGHVPIHAAAVDLPGVGMMLIGGTGATGKTSLALELCQQHGGAFGSDDMTVVDATGMAHPNLAYPKVYGYNLVDSEALRHRVLGSAGPMDRAQWAWRLRRVGPSGVRRRVAPSRLFDRVVSRPAPLARYVILVRGQEETIRIEPLDHLRAAALSLDVLHAEYADLHRHLRWHAFNRLASGREPTIELDRRFDTWRMMLESVLANVECLLVHVPAGLGARRMREHVARELAPA